MKTLLAGVLLTILSPLVFGQRPATGASARVVARFPEAGKPNSPFDQEFKRRLRIHAAENQQATVDDALALKLAEEVAEQLPTLAEKPEIEFKVLLIIKRYSDTWHPLFLPVRSGMTEENIAKARHCFEIQTPDMVHDITKGKVRFTPTVVVSSRPLRHFDPKRRDSAEFMEDEMAAELATFAKPGDYDSVGYYFLHYDDSCGYQIPRAGYGVGYFSAANGIGMFAISSTPGMNPRDEIYLHEWMHGLDGYYGSKGGVRLPKGALHGSGNYDAHYSEAKAWRPQDTFRGYMEWYRDILNGQVPDGGGFAGLGGPAWRHGPMRDEARRKGVRFKTTPLPKGDYQQWVHEMMKGDLKNAPLGTTLLPTGLKPGEIKKDGRPWTLESWSGSGETTARYAAGDGGTFHLDSGGRDHAALSCEVPVDPGCNYVFSAEVKTAGVKIKETGGIYSVLLAAGDSATTKNMSGSVNWTPLVIPFTTKPAQTSVTVRMQMGGRASLTSGHADFRNVKLRKVAYPEEKTKF